MVQKNDVKDFTIIRIQFFLKSTEYNTNYMLDSHDKTKQKI